MKFLSVRIAHGELTVGMVVHICEHNSMWIGCVWKCGRTNPAIL